MFQRNLNLHSSIFYLHIFRLDLHHLLLILINSDIEFFFIFSTKSSIENLQFSSYVRQPYLSFLQSCTYLKYRKTRIKKSILLLHNEMLIHTYIYIYYITTSCIACFITTTIFFILYSIESSDVNVFFLLLDIFNDYGRG